MAELNGQLSIFELLIENNPSVSKLKKNDTVYIVILDTIKTATVDDVFQYDGDERYCLKLLVGFSVKGYADMNKTLFLNKGDAITKAKENSNGLVTINPNEMPIYEKQAYSFIRGCDEHKLYIAFAKMGDRWLVWKDVLTYTFYEEFPNTKARDKQYISIEKQVEKHKSNPSFQASNYTFEKLYRVNDNMFASLGYAVNHGAVYGGTRKAYAENM